MLLLTFLCALFEIALLVPDNRILEEPFTDRSIESTLIILSRFCCCYRMSRTLISLNLLIVVSTNKSPPVGPEWHQRSRSMAVLQLRFVST